MKPELLRNIYPHACDPDGKLDLASMRKDLAFFQEQGLVTNKDQKIESILETSFVEAAVKELGPYKK